MNSFLLSKESLFAFYIVSGTIKHIYPILNIRGIPDITLLSAFLLVIVMFRDTSIEELKSFSADRVELISIITLFYLFIIFSLSYTSSESYSLTKTVNFGTVVLALFFPMFVKKFNIRFFLYTFTIFAFVISVIFLNFYISYLNQDGTVLLHMSYEEAREVTAVYLSIAELTGAIILYYFFNSSENSLVRWSIIVVATTVLVASGGRGALIFTILILEAYLLYQIIISLSSFQIKKIVFPILISSLLMTILVFSILTKSIDSKNSKSLKLIENSIERLLTLINSEGGGDSAYSRVLFTKFSIDKINQKPILGYGIGSFGFEYHNIDIHESPHNIFLEVWFELGFIPLLLFIALFYLVFRHILESKQSWAMALYFYLLLNLLKSGSLIDMRTTVAFFAIFVLAKEFKETEALAPNRVKEELK